MIQARVRQATADAVANGDVIVVQGKRVLDVRPTAARDKGDGATIPDGDSF